MPVGDIQHGAPGSNLEKFKRHMDWGMQQGAYFIGMGDYVDVASPSGRKKIRDADFYDSIVVALEEKAEEAQEEFYNVVKGTEGRWLGLLEGHHYYEFEDGRTTDTWLAGKLGTTFLGTSTIIELKFKGTRSIAGQLYATHGQGSSKNGAAALNKLDDMRRQLPSVDIFLVGHYSLKDARIRDALVPVFGKNPRLRAKRRIMAVTGGFMQGYVVGNQRAGRASGTYVERAMMPPLNLGALVIYVRPVHTEHEDRLDLSISL